MNRKVNHKQLEVLKWIAVGCLSGQEPFETYKTTAVALQNRRLVDIDRRRGMWAATLTELGEYFAQHKASSPASTGSKDSEDQVTPPNLYDRTTVWASAYGFPVAAWSYLITQTGQPQPSSAQATTTTRRTD